MIWHSRWQSLVLTCLITAAVSWVLLTVLDSSLVESGGSPSKSSDVSHQDRLVPIEQEGSGLLPDPGPGQVGAVGPWEVAVLETDRDATEDWTAEDTQYKTGLTFVMTTIYLKYNGETPVDFLDQLGFDFGSPEGTQIGYNPWDDWCPAWRDDVNGIGVMLPGEARVVRVCVPVALEDAPGLEMDVIPDPANNYDWDNVRRFELPPDGVTFPAPVGSHTSSPYAIAVSHLEAKGVWRGDVYTPLRSRIVGEGKDFLGDPVVYLEAAFAVEDLPGAFAGRPHGPEARGPSGSTNYGGRCSDDKPYLGDTEAVEVFVCWSVNPSDVKDLVAVFTDSWVATELLVLEVPDPS